MSRRLLTAILPLLLALPALAQRVYWEPNAGSLAYGQVSQIQLVFENCEPDGDPKIPAVDGLEMGASGTGSSFSMENMKVTRKFSINYAVQPTKRPEVRIPAFDVPTDKGSQRVASATFAIGNATVGQTAVPLESAASAALAPAEGAFWAGEVFPVSYTLDVAQRFRPRAQGSVVWKPAPLAIEDWKQPETFEATRAGEPRYVVVYKTRGSISTPGSYHIPTASQDLVLVVNTGSNMFGPFGGAEMVQHTVTSNSPTLTIKPLPDGAPAEFNGAVGQFRLISKVVPATVAVGEPVTWTLELGGTGNWPDLQGLPAREASKDFKALQPQAKRTPVEGKLFDAKLTEDIVLIPTKPGTYTLGPVAFSYFDPRDGTYKASKTEATTVTVTANTGAESSSRPLFTPPAAVGTPETPTPSAPAVTGQLAPPPAEPAAIPRDPLLGSDTGWRPLSSKRWTALLVLSVLWIAPAWLILAALRARSRDPLLPRRQARARLAQTLAYLHGASSAAARTQTLHAWQRDVAVLLGVDHAAPAREAIDAAVHNSQLTIALSPPWAELWAETDRCLYGPSHSLPENWTVRAEAALEATIVPGWNVLSLFAPANLFPWFAAARPQPGRSPGSSAAALLIGFGLAACLGLPAPARAAAASQGARSLAVAGLSAYRTGDFAEAEKAWRQAVVQTPTDSVARYNLGLALAQQEHWPEAAAQWTSAFLLNPRNESVRWHLALGYEHAGYTPAGLGEFAQAAGPHLVARSASPAEWQWLFALAGVLAGAGVLILLLRAYRGTGNGWTRPAGFAVLGLGVLLGFCAFISLRFYGEAADPRAAIVWHQTVLRSVPTEADTQQKTSSLPAGSLALVDKEFFGWLRLAFPNGQTGWVRKEDVVWMYR